MKRMILSLVALMTMLGTVQAQRLVSVKNYGANWDRSLISLKNKPNGIIFRLREEKEKLLTDETAKKQYLERMTGLKEFIENQPDGITEFDETLVKHLLSKVTVFEDSLLFEFKSGFTVTVKV